MTDNKERTIKDILNDEIERKLAENPPKVPTLEEFKAMAYERLEEKKVENTEAEAEVRTVVANTKTDKKRKLYIACGAVGFVIAVMICAFAINMFTTDVGADKNPKDEIVTEDGVIIEDGGWGSSEGEDNVWVIEDWKDVESAKETVPDLLIPKYIPDGYQFKQLTINNFIENDITYEYLYFGSCSELLEIEIISIKGGEVSSNINDVTKTLDTIKGKVYIQSEKKIATIRLHDGTVIHLIGSQNDNEIVKIIESIN